MFLGSEAGRSEESEIKAIRWLRAILGVTLEGAGSKTPNIDTATLCRGPCGFGASALVSRLVGSSCACTTDKLDDALFCMEKSQVMNNCPELQVVALGFEPTLAGAASSVIPLASFHSSLKRPCLSVSSRVPASVTVSSLGSEQGTAVGFGIVSELILTPHLVCPALF